MAIRLLSGDLQEIILLPTRVLGEFYSEVWMVVFSLGDVCCYGIMGIILLSSDLEEIILLPARV